MAGLRTNRWRTGCKSWLFGCAAPLVLYHFFPMFANIQLKVRYKLNAGLPLKTRRQFIRQKSKKKFQAVCQKISIPPMDHKIGNKLPLTYLNYQEISGEINFFS